jgi:hypothetical protein
MGVVAVTLASLLSELRSQNLDGPRDDEQKARSNKIVATVVSLVTTVVTFGVTMIGAGGSLRGLKTIVNRISAAGQSVRTRISAHGAPVHTSGQKLKQKENQEDVDAPHMTNSREMAKD